MKILVIKTSSLGDIIHAFGALDYLKNRFPQAQIDWVVEKSGSELVQAHPHIYRTWVIESKKWRTSLSQAQTWKQIGGFRKELREIEYDLLFDLQGNMKSGLIVGLARAQKKIGFHWRNTPEWPNGLFTGYKIALTEGQNIREDYLSLVKGFFHDDVPYIPRPVCLKLTSEQLGRLESLIPSGLYPTLVCPSSAWPNKCIAEEKLILILKQLDHPTYWFVWGSDKELEMAHRLSKLFPNSQILERLSLPLLQHVMSRSKLVVAMDSLPLHLCATTPTPTLSFFGPSAAAKYKPLGTQHAAIQGECPYGIRFEKRCPQLRTCKTGLCLKSSDSWRFSVDTKPSADFDYKSILELR